MAKYQELSPKAMGIAASLVSIIASFFGSFGSLAMRPGMMTNPVYTVGSIVVAAIFGFVSGYLVAFFYNWALGRKISFHLK